MNKPAEIAKLYVNAGVAKTKMNKFKVFLLAIMAGFFISVAGIASSAADVSIPGASVAKLIAAMVFPAGLSMVILAGSELFTGNCLLVIPLLEKRISVKDVLTNWVIVYLGNLAGSLIFTLLLAYGGTYSLFGEGLASLCVTNAVAKCSMTFLQAFIKGILCNIFVCIAVWITFAADNVSGKILGLFFPIMLFVLCGFEHSVANMGYIPNGIFASMLYNIEAPGLTWGAFFIKNLIPVTFGNIVGGCFVGFVYWFVYLHENNKKTDL